MYTLLKNKLDGLKRGVVETAQDLISTPSTTYNEAEVAKKLEQRLSGLGYDKVVRDDYGNVAGVIFGREAEPTVLLTSHMDTVEADRSGPWEMDPLSGQERNGNLYGLGAADCKGGLVAQMYAGALLRRSLLPLHGNLVFAATAAEGNGRSIGVRQFMKDTLPALGLKASYAILGEPTGLGLYYGHDGWVQLELKVEGSNPFHVDDAARALIDAYQEERDGIILSADESGPRFQDLMGHRRATISMNRRMGVSENVDEVLRRIQQDARLAAGHPDTAIEVAVRQQTEKLYNGRYELVRHQSNAWGIDPYDELVVRARQSLAAAGRDVRPGRWKLGRFGMGTAGSVLSKELDVPTIGYGPGLEDLAHACNEYVEIAKLTEAVFGTAVIVHGLIGIPVYGWTSDEI